VTLSSVTGWRLLDEGPPASGAAAVARDAELLEAVRAGSGPPTARIWENERCLVAARADRRLPRFDAAAAALAADGWPVHVRESGGTTVPNGPGIVSLSLAFRPGPDAPFTLESGYDALCLPIERALAALRIRTERGPIERAFCDGRFDLAAGGRKIAGTAQRWRAGPGGPSPERGAVLLHGVILVDTDRAAGTDAVNRFYAAAGGARRADPDASITLREAWAASGDPRAAALAGAIVGDFRRALAAALRELTGCA
jgi:octanoyl-[GcvH]:protein N-octanoyltransferase